VTGPNKKILVLKPNLFGLKSNCSDPACNGIVCLEILVCCEKYDKNCRQEVALKEYELLTPTNYCLPVCTESKCLEVLCDNKDESCVDVAQKK
jgi:hypothetical protein